MDDSLAPNVEAWRLAELGVIEVIVGRYLKTLRLKPLPISKNLGFMQASQLSEKALKGKNVENYIR